METIYLQHWKFSKAETKGSGRDPWTPDFDDSNWQDVVVPHDWAVSFPFSRENSSGTGYLPGGTAWYRAVFSARPGEGREKVFINFDGVYKNSQVWCNGYYLGKRPSGYIPFRYDISHCVHEGDDNTITVKVSHEDIADSRWYTGSGIYRKAYLQFHDSLYIPQESVIIKTECLDGKGIIRITGKAVNQSGGSAGDLQISARIEAEDGGSFNTEAHSLAPDAIDAGGENDFEIEAKIDNPRLWSPETPKLYRLSLELRARLKNGQAENPASSRAAVYTSPPIRVGIRTIRLDPDKGFFINGRSEKLKGVCVHHDAGCLGAAVWPEVWRRRLEKLKAAGCNAIRCSHNPHMGELYDLCDEMGFFVMDEAFDEWEGCKNKWFHGHNVYPPVLQGYYENFPQWHERDLADMVIQGRNHPSIILWSIGNEIDYPNDPYAHPLFTEMTGNNDANKPKSEMVYNPQKPNMERLALVAAELVKIVKKHDSTRPVLTAAAFPELSSRLGFLDALDAAGYNYKEQFYEEDHKRFPHLPILGSENGHHLAAWKAVTDHEYISGQFLWTGIDYLGEAHGWPIRGSSAGILDTAGNEKIGYFRRKALWKDEPVLYLAAGIAKPDTGRELQPWELSRSWNYLPGSPVTVICYTNLEEAELFCNGKSCGSMKRPADREYLTWTVPFERGSLEVSARKDSRTIKDVLESVLPVVQIQLRPWQSAGTKAAFALETPGAYKLIQVELELLDEKSRLCVTAEPMIQVSLAGPGKLLGIENGDLSDCTEYSATRRRVYQGRLVIYVLKSLDANEALTLTAAAEGYEPAGISL